MNNINVGEEIKKYIEDCRSNIKYYHIKNKIFYNAEKIKKNNKDDKKIKKITTSQLRLLLSNTVIIKNKIQVETRTKKEDEISEKLENEIKYLLVKHIYQCGRDLDVKSFDENFKISKAIKEIGNSAKNFNKFYHYLEEIIAYMKYYDFDDK